MEATKTRADHLRDLMEIFHRSGYGDYDATYDEFAATYFDNEDVTCNLCGDYKSAKIHTDSELHPDDAIDGLSLHSFQGFKLKPIPKYASCAEDETYGMINVFETLGEALADQSGVPSSGDTLNVPVGIYDLDTGEKIETCNVTMTTEAFAVLCGIVHPSDVVNTQGIFSDAWEELRESFPWDYFKKVAKERGEDFYDQDAGL